MRIIIILLVIIIAFASITVIQNRNFNVSFYAIKNANVSANLRVIELADLHNSEYGKNNSRLIKKIKSLHPDLIIYCTEVFSLMQK